MRLRLILRGKRFAGLLAEIRESFDEADLGLGEKAQLERCTTSSKRRGR